MKTHTTDPWTININQSTGEPEFIRAFIPDEYGGEMYDIANMGCDETGNAAANAQLIAAAPDLLRALQMVDRIWSGDQTANLDPESPLAIVRAAITKATKVNA